jgi:hypothetical protein
MGLKCGATRSEADEWLHRYPDDAGVMAYIGRSGWNALRLDGAIDDDELREVIDASYDAVVAKLPKRIGPSELGRFGLGAGASPRSSASTGRDPGARSDATRPEAALT